RRPHRGGELLVLLGAGARLARQPRRRDEQERYQQAGEQRPSVGALGADDANRHQSMASRSIAAAAAASTGIFSVDMPRRTVSSTTPSFRPRSPTVSRSGT